MFGHLGARRMDRGRLLHEVDQRLTVVVLDERRVLEVDLDHPVPHDCHRTTGLPACGHEPVEHIGGVGAHVARRYASPKDPEGAYVR